MSVGFGGTIVSDSQTDTYFGSAKFFEGSPQDEYVSDSIPNASGLAETWITTTHAEHKVEVVWYTTNEGSLKSTIHGKKDGRYRTLSVPTVSGDRSLPFCRLADISWGARQKGIKTSGTACYVLVCTLTFIQAKVD